MFTAHNRRGGAAGIILFLIVAAILAAYIFMGDTVRGIFGGATAPSDPGPAPAQATMPAPSTDPKVPKSGPGLPQDDQLSFGTFTPPEREPVKTDLPQNQQANGHSDDGQAKTLLTKMEDAYHNFQFDEVQQLRGQVTELDASPDLKAQARSRGRSARQLAALMDELNSAKFGLARNLETDPRLVTIVNEHGSEVQAIAITSTDSKEPVNTDDPVAFIERLRDAGQNVPMMTTSRIAADYKPSQIRRVDPADTASLVAERRGEFDRRFKRLRDSDSWNDALALFEAARFAYGNRIDDKVTDLLDRAILLDPTLAKSVKEDEAQPYFEKMVGHLEKGNKGSAAGFLNSLKKNFADTVIYEQARAYYDGNAKAALAAAAEAKRRIQEARKKEFEERRRLAREAKDEARVKELEEQEEVIEQQSEPEEAEVDGDKAKADALFKRGEDLYAQAIDAGNTSKRDDLYGEAEKWLRKAQAVYAKLVEQGDSSVESDLVRCNQLVYGCRKQRRF